MNNRILSSLQQKGQFKYPFFFLGIYITTLLCTVCLANRFTLVGHLLEPGGIFIFPLSFTICDIVGEVYGYAYPRLFIWIGIGCEFMFSFVVTIVSHLPAPLFFLKSQSYIAVFDPTMRYVFSGTIALLVGEFLNVYLLAKWKIRLKGKWFVLRCWFSTALGQLSLTIIVDLLNYFGKLNQQDFIWMMFCGYFSKLIYSSAIAFPAFFIVEKLKKIEKIDYFDIDTNFNPFVLSLANTNAENSDNLAEHVHCEI